MSEQTPSQIPQSGLGAGGTRLSARSIVFMVFVLAIVVVLDQVSKFYVVASLQLHESIEVIPGYFSIILTHNRGAAFGILSGLPEGYRQAALATTTIFALGAVFYLLIHDYYDDLIAQGALAMIVGGAIGNIIDRVRIGKVVDFIDVYYGPHHWPAFNVADSAICVGVCALLLLRPLRGSKKIGAETPAIEALPKHGDA